MRRPIAALSPFRPLASLAAGAVLVLAAAPAATGQLAFVEGQRQTTIGSPSSLAIADFDRDGFPDVLSTSASAYLNVMRGDGRGGLLPAVRLGYASASGVIAGDFDEDGSPDVVVLYRSASSLSVSLGDGRLGFGAPARRIIELAPLEGIATDHDLDGHLDLVLIGGGEARVFYGNGAGAFPLVVNPNVSAFSDIASVEARDLDANGWPDLTFVARVAAVPALSELRVFLGDGTRTFGAPIISPMMPISAADAAMADWTGDAIPDLVVSAFPSAPSRLLRGLGDGTFGAPELRLDANAGELAAADFDADGIVDLAASGSFSGNLRVFRSDGLGGFESPVRAGGNIGPIRIAAADLDADGLADLVAANPSDVTPLLNRSTAPCVAGTVNRGRGAVTNVLFVNDSTGGPARRLRLLSFEPVTIFMASPPAAVGAAPFALFAWAGPPAPGEERPMPYGIGVACKPMLAPHGAPRPGAIWNNTGKASLGAATFPSSPAPSIVLSRPAGLGRSVTFFLQGVIADPGSMGTRPGSVTNGIVVEVN